MRYFAYLGCFFALNSAFANPITYEIAPYLWASSLHGQIQIGRQKVEVDKSFIDLIKDLDFGAMVWAAAFKDRWGVFLNGVYTKVSDRRDFENYAFSSSSELSILTSGVSYRIFPFATTLFFTEPYVGARYTNNSTEIAVNSFHAEQKVTWADGVLGARADYLLTPSFSLQGSADYGQGNRSHSYNLSALLGYQSPQHFKNTYFYLGYRFLHQNIEKGQDRSFYQWRMDIAGPVAGAMFKF